MSIRKGCQLLEITIPDHSGLNYIAQSRKLGGNEKRRPFRDAFQNRGCDESECTEAGWFNDRVKRFAIPILTV